MADDEKGDWVFFAGGFTTETTKPVTKDQLAGALRDLLNAQNMMQHASDYLPGIKRINLDECKENARAILLRLKD